MGAQHARQKPVTDRSPPDPATEAVRRSDEGGAAMTTAPAGVVPTVELRHIFKSFNGNPVLEDVSFQVAPGQVHAIVGHNGAGKSTLMKILQGVYRADAGDVVLGGDVLAQPSPSLLRSLGVGMVYQERSLVPTLTALDSLFLNGERRGPLGRIDRRRELVEAAQICVRLGVSPELLSRRVDDLSEVEQEMLEVAKALRVADRLIILDEPTGPLGGSEVEDLFRVVRATAATGVAVVLITHHLREVFDIADFVTCLREGRVTLSASTSETNLEQLVTSIVGQRQEAVASDGTTPTEASGSRVAAPDETAALEVSSLGVRGKLSDITFRVGAGEIVGLAGLAGSGRSTLLKTLFGDIRYSDGEVMLYGKRYRPRHPADAIHEGVYLIPEDRAVHGLIAARQITENVSLSILDRLRSWFVLRMSRGRQRAGRAMRLLAIRASSPDQAVAELSGGNQQKVVIAKAIQTDMRLLLLDEPTFGVDIGAAKDVAAYVKDFVGKGSAALWASSDLNELLDVADRILIVADGRIREALRRGTPEFDEASVLARIQRG